MSGSSRYRPLWWRLGDSNRGHNSTFVALSEKVTVLDTWGILGLSSLVKRVPDKNSYPSCWMSQPINNPRAWGNIAPVVFICQINLLSRVSTSVAMVANVFPGTPPG